MATGHRAGDRRLSWAAVGERRRQQVGNALTFGVLLVGGVIFAAPFLWMIGSSLKTQYEINTFPPVFFPAVPQWSNYGEVFQKFAFGRYFANSLFVSLSVTTGVIISSSLAGYAFARIRFPYRDRLFLLYLGTMMIPGAVTLIPAFVLMRTFHWLDTYYALIVPGLISAWGTFMMRQFMLTIPRELEDAALIDGANRFRIYWQLILPLSKPVIATLALFTFIGSWNDFLWPVLMLNSQHRFTLPLGLASFQERNALYTPWHLIMAASVVTVTPIIVLFVFGQKYYVQGIVTTGLKG